MSGEKQVRSSYFSFSSTIVPEGRSLSSTKTPSGRYLVWARLHLVTSASVSLIVITQRLDPAKACNIKVADREVED